MMRLSFQIMVVQRGRMRASHLAANAVVPRDGPHGPLGLQEGLSAPQAMDDRRPRSVALTHLGHHGALSYHQDIDPTHHLISSTHLK